MASHNDFGKLAEEKATQFLIEQGFEILERNWFFHKAEIDIIARKENIIHIVEVKARHTDAFILPQEAVTPKKIKLLIEASNEYVQDLEDAVEVQFDIIGIISKKGSLEIDFIEDAFESID